MVIIIQEINPILGTIGMHVTIPLRYKHREAKV